MAHIDQMLAGIHNYDERKKIDKIMSGAMPKLGIAYLPANAVENAYQFIESLVDPTLLKEKKVDKFGYTKDTTCKKYGAYYPVMVRVLNISEAMGVRQQEYMREDGTLDKEAWDKDRREADNAAMTIFNDLIKLGCVALPYSHNYKRYTNRSVISADGIPQRESISDTQYCVVLPCVYPSTRKSTPLNPEGPHWPEPAFGYHKQEFERDTQSAERMIAYMLTKKIKTKDGKLVPLVIPEEIIHGKGFGELPFLRAACSKENAKFLKEKLDLSMPLKSLQLVVERSGALTRQRDF